MPVPYHVLHQTMTVGALKTVPEETKLLLARLGRNQFWTGLIGTALGLGLSVNLLNNWFTKRKITRENN